MNKQKIEMHLTSAIAQATPNVLDAILAGNYQQDEVQTNHNKVIPFSRLRRFSGLAAACLLFIVCTGGFFTYSFYYRIASMIELDVNPSIELSVSASKKVLRARAANQDAEEILDDMDLTGVDLQVAVNAILGSMVNHGYFTELENSILVTVTNHSPKKAEALRKEVVVNIEASLAEQQVKAVVFDQKVNPSDQLVELAARYGISYGKANFLQKLIEKDPSLSMEELAPLSMDAIANLIKAKNIDISDLENYEYGKEVAKGLEENLTSSDADSSAAAPDQTASPESSLEGMEETTGDGSEGELAFGTQAETSEDQTSAAETVKPADQVPVTIGWIDFEDNIIRVEFSGKVKWKNQTVAVRDEHGEYFPAMFYSTFDDMCEILVYGISSSGRYTVVIGGIKNNGDQQYSTAVGSVEIEAGIPLDPEAGTATPAETTPAEIIRAEQLEETTAESAAAAVSEGAIEASQKPVSVSSLTRDAEDHFDIQLSEAVNWDSSIIKVTDEKGTAYVVTTLEAKEKRCKVAIDGLQPDKTYTLTFGGLIQNSTKKPVKVTSYFSIVE